jgi:hypothetical protein
VTITDNHTWVPQVILGGKSPPGDGVTPYLLYLKPGCMFLTRDNISKDRVDLSLFKVVYVFNKARLVAEMDGNGNAIPHYVDPLEFCRRFEFYEILLEGKEDDDPVNRADTAAGLPNNEPTKGISSLDERTEGREV